MCVVRDKRQQRGTAEKLGGHLCTGPAHEKRDDAESESRRELVCGGTLDRLGVDRERMPTCVEGD